MFRKIYLLIFFTVILNNCGFSPLYTTNAVNNFNIAKLTMEGDKTINNYLKINLRQFQENQNAKKLNVNVNTEYNKRVLSKDKTGKITEYEISTDITFKIDQKNGLSRELVISETKIMKAISDKFEEQKEERIAKQNFASIISKKLINELSIIDDN